jgi:hypothetical protein
VLLGASPVGGLQDFRTVALECERARTPARTLGVS